MSTQPSIKGYINLAKVSPDHVFEKDGKRWLSIVLWDSPDDKYGNDYRIDQDIGSEDRLKGVKAPILGNAKITIKRPGMKHTDAQED